ncbi:MAG TPA: sialate O-acetylesterase [Armatimonadota bacterium]|nr:sialate O-acetylesterase [Armatimonadota bacterium]
MLTMLICLAAPRVACAELSLPAIISDGMILQSRMRVPIWGSAPPGVEVSVRFAGEEVRAEADADGRWRVDLGPLDVSTEPRVMTIQSGDEVLRISDVLVGEVWVAAGQSNMWYPLQMMSNHGEHKEAFDALEHVKVFRAAIALRADQWDKLDYARAMGTSAIADYFARDLAEAYPGVPIAIVDTSVGATWAESWMSKETLDAYNADPAHEQKITMDGTDYGGNPDFQPTRWYEGIITKVIPFAVRGVIWYQGEGNAAKPAQHSTLLPALIAQWRRDFERPDMPFLICQLPPFHPRAPWDPRDQVWAYFRESQLRIWQAVPNTGMVVAPECGAVGNIHSTHKDEFGERLALAARAIAYGEDIVYSGPIYSRHEVGGGRVIVHFDHVGAGLKVMGGAALMQFEICGADGQFVPANAHIDGDTVVVSSPDVPDPAHVRYAWTNYPADMTEVNAALDALAEESKGQPEPEVWLRKQIDTRYAENSQHPIEANLYNLDGLPASPFRTDDLPFPTK